MASELRNKVGTQWSLADHAGDFSPTAANDLEQGTPTNVQFSLASIATTAARQSAQIDFGATRAPTFSMMAAIEFAASVVAGTVVDFYLAPSPDPTAANGNPGGVSGSDAAYTGTAGSTVAESVAQLISIGSFTVTDDATTVVQMAFIGQFAPPERYGSIVMVNNTAVSTHSDDVESHVVITEVVPEGQ